MVIRNFWYKSYIDSVVVGTDFGLWGVESESDQCGDDEIVVLDGRVGVFGFEGVLVGYLGEIDFGDVESIRDVLHGGVISDSAVDHIVELSRNCVILFEKHSLYYTKILYHSF